MKTFKKQPSKVAYFSLIEKISLLPGATQMAQTVDFIWIIE
jgi:hypothetical protein